MHLKYKILDIFFLFAILPPYSVATRHKSPCKVDTLKPCKLRGF